MRRSAPLAAAIAGLWAAPLTAQAVLERVGATVQADLLYFADRPEAAYELLVEHLETMPVDFDALWRVARAGVVVGIGFENNRDQNRYLDPALHYAERAVRLRPHDVDALYWRGVAAGRRAMNAKPGRAAQLAQVAYDDAHAILRQDSTHAGAHNMLGKLNYEVMALSRVERLVARTFLGNAALDEASWRKAEVHLAKAVEAAPDYVLFQFDLGALYEKRGRDREAEVHLRRALSLPAAQPIDAGIQARAVALLEEMGR